MVKVKVVSLKAHSPDGNKRYSAGEEYRISLDAAKVLAAMKFVRIDSAPVEVTTVVAPESKPKSKRKEYERRDMRPEE